MTTESSPSSTELHSLAIGIATRNSGDKIIEVYYPQPLLKPDSSVVAAVEQVFGKIQKNSVFDKLDPTQLRQLSNALDDHGSAELKDLLHHLQTCQQPLVLTAIMEDSAPESVAEVYLKLHLLSHRLCKPHSVDLSGAFGVLHNIAWTNQGAIDLPDLPARQLSARIKGELLEVMSVDKFPKMSNYVMPSGVRIAHTARVRLGAYLGEGTTVMHEGFVNFNAGTEGAAMIEGRISAGVMIGQGSDLGGGCSTMGTLSGGGKETISVGRDCLIGANAGIGLPLGDRCVVEAGLYVTAGTRVKVLDQNNEAVKVVKARELSGLNDLLFRRNSETGAVECKTNKTEIALNEELHAHN